jgi:putative addiction module component (TIGR02574 family)
VDSRTSKLLEEALKLPPEARAALAGSLLQSLDTDLDEDAAEAWEAEIAERLKRLESGSETLVPWAEVRRRLRGRG